MKATIRLFKALPITTRETKEANKKLLQETTKRGFVFSTEVIATSEGTPTYSITWDGRNKYNQLAAPGIYIIRLEYIPFDGPKTIQFQKLGLIR